MSRSALARRLGVSTAAVAKLERAESRGGITITKLQDVAAALDCELIYALVPNSSLEDTVQRQARRVASQQLGYVTGTMVLEDQDLSPEARAEYLDVYSRDLIAHSDIWREGSRQRVPDRG